MSRTIALTISILFISTVSLAQSGPQLNRDPATVKFVTSDIENFWRAYDLAAKETTKRNASRSFSPNISTRAAVYFLIGVTSSGGTTGPSGLLIGTEMYGKTEKSPMNELNAWLRAVLSTVDNVPAIVAHESCHYNQRNNSAPGPATSARQGVARGRLRHDRRADSGRNINDHLKIYGKTHEAEIWRDFEADMYKPDISNGFTTPWLRKIVRLTSDIMSAT